jgi:hypothetical protein
MRMWPERQSISYGARLFSKSTSQGGQADATPLITRKRERWGETILVRLCRRAWRELSDILFVHPRNKPIAAIEHVKANQRVALERVRKSGQLAKGIFLHSEFKAGTDASAFER